MKSAISAMACLVGEIEAANAVAAYLSCSTGEAWDALEFGITDGAQPAELHLPRDEWARVAVHPIACTAAQLQAAHAAARPPRESVGIPDRMRVAHAGACYLVQSADEAHQALDAAIDRDAPIAEIRRLLDECDRIRECQRRRELRQPGPAPAPARSAGQRGADV